MFCLIEKSLKHFKTETKPQIVLQCLSIFFPIFTNHLGLEGIACTVTPFLPHPLEFASPPWGSMKAFAPKDQKASFPCSCLYETNLLWIQARPQGSKSQPSAHFLPSPGKIQHCVPLSAVVQLGSVSSLGFNPGKHSNDSSLQNLHLSQICLKFSPLYLSNYWLCWFGDIFNLSISCFGALIVGRHDCAFSVMRTNL